MPSENNDSAQIGELVGFFWGDAMNLGPGTFLSRHWDEDVNNPLNWPQRKKYLILGLVSYIDLLTPLTNMMLAPGLPAMQKDFNNHDNTLATFAMTIYVLGFCVGPLVFAPLSERYGRAIVYKGCLAMFLVLTVACGLASSLEMLICFRFMAGCFGAAPVAIGGAMVYDLFRVGERGRAMAIYTAGPTLGNLLGPPIGGLIIQHKSWRWVFWNLSILTAVALICSFPILKETHAPVILAQKLETGPEAGAEPDDRTPLNPDSAHLHAASAIGAGEASYAEPDVGENLAHAFRRPLELLFLSPVCGSCSLVIILVAGTTNLIFASLGRIFQDFYGFSTSASGLIYLAVTTGFVIATFVFGSTSDRVSRYLTTRNEDEAEPEFRLPAMVFGLPLIAVGLICYGWSTQNQVFWIVPTLGLSVIGIGITTALLSLQIYVIDAFAEFAASALAATTVARSLGGALIPLAGPMLYRRFGLGWGNSLIGLANLAMCIIPCLLFANGKTWRERSLAKNM